MTIIGAAGILYGLGIILAHLITIVLVFALSVVVAFMLEPLVGRMERVGFRRGGATGIVYLTFLLAFAGGIFSIGGGLVTQFGQLDQQLPIYSRELQEQGIPAVQAWLASHHISIDLSQIVPNAGAALQSGGTGVVGAGLDVVTGVTDILVNFILVMVISLYLVLDGKNMRERLDHFVPGNFRRPVQFVETSLIRILGGYIRGQLIMAAIIGTSSGLGCWFFGVHYPLVIGLFAFFFELIPMLGPVLAAIPAVIISLFQPFPLVLIVIGYFIVMQVIESNVLGPRITGHAVGLHPIASILALVGGSEVAGVWGALFAVPLVGLAAVLGKAALDELMGRTPEVPTRSPRPWPFPLPRRASEKL